jgi:uncharacterized membrane protein YfcA
MFTTPLNALGIFLAGGVTGVMGAILGTGGGVFLIPLLVLALGVPMHYAVATSILSVIATSSAVASTNVERGTANMRLGMTLEIATSLGAIAGGLTAYLLSAGFLEGLFAVVLVPTAALMWRGRGPEAAVIPAEPTGSEKHAPPILVAENPGPGEESLGALGARFLDEAEGRTVTYRVRRLWAGLGISFVAGNLSGLLGIGGGVFKVPALHLLCDVPIKAAAATSNFMIGVTAAASAFLYYGRGQVRPMLTATVVLGVLAGSALGSVLNRRVRGDAVRRLFAVLLMAVAVQMFFRVLLQGK